MLASFPKVPKTKVLKIEFSITPLSFDASSPRTRANIRHWAPSLSLIVWVYLHSNFRGELRKCMYFETECEMAVQGHARSVISVPIENVYGTSYWSSIVTLVLSCPDSEILQVFCSEQRPHPYSTRILWVFPLD